MDQNIEYIIAGGPQHGQVCRHVPDVFRLAQPILLTNDGRLCVAAACRHNPECNTRYILLHPQATGEEFLTILAA